LWTEIEFINNIYNLKKVMWYV